MSLVNQLANIGSEFERALKAKEANKKHRFKNAFKRLLELIDLTISDPQLKGRRLREIVKMREAICDVFTSNNNHENTIASFRKEFHFYGIAARRQV